MRLIHITDPHLSSLESCRFISLHGKRRSGYLSWYKNRRHIHRPEILEFLTAAVLAESPDRILLTGDLIHIGLEREMAEAADWLQRLGPPERVTLIPGNHDIYADDSLAAMKRHWGDYLPEVENDGDPSDGYPVVNDIGETRLIRVNSSVVTRIFSAAGEVGPEQLDALPGTFSREQFNVLMIHHPPLPGMTKRRKALRDAQSLDLLFERYRPDVVLYGHIHVNRDSEHRGTRMFCTASASSRNDASYRVFDLSGRRGHWTVRMQLKSIERGPGEAVDFALCDEMQWDVVR